MNKDNSSLYLYKRKGPWPQPAPEHPHGQAAAVLHLPLDQKLDWYWHVASRYMWQMLTYTPVAAVQALFNHEIKAVSDRRFTEILCDGVMSTFLCALLDPEDKKGFGEILDDIQPGQAWLKSDFRPMKYVHVRKNVFTATTVALFKYTSPTQYEVVAILVDEKRFTPKDGSAWELAKYFVLQGAGVCVTLLKHPASHFPTDAVNAITQTALPMKHPIFKLLMPHFRLALGVSDAVLHGNGTVLKPSTYYSPYPGTMDGHVDLVATGWRGLVNPDGAYNSAYVPYSFKLDCDEIPSGFGVFLTKYWRTIEAFVERVTQTIDPNDPELLRWAQYIAPWLPGFPKPEELTRGNTLARALTAIIHQVSVRHSAEHYDFSQNDILEVPMRLRKAPPRTAKPDSAEKLDRSKLNRWIDVFQYKMCMKMFFNAYPVKRLCEVDYGFESEELRRANQDFLAALKKTEAEIIQSKSKNYIPLEEIATSIQF